MEKKLYRNENDQVIAGVASGIAEHLNVDATLVRVGFVLAVFAGLSGVLIYIILWIVIPLKPYYINTDYRVNDDRQPPPAFEGYRPPVKQGNGRIIAGGILLFLGAFFLARELNLIPYWLSIHRLWPLALIIPGILILSKSKRKEPFQPSAGQEWGKRQAAPDQPSAAASADEAIVKTPDDQL